MRLNKCFLKRVAMVQYSYVTKRACVYLERKGGGEYIKQYVSDRNASRIVKLTNGKDIDYSKL